MECTKLDTKGHILYASMYTKFPEQVNLERGKIDSCQGLGGKWEQGVPVTECSVFFWGDENILKLYRGDGCTNV